LHNAMQVPAAAQGLELDLIDDNECLLIRKWPPDLGADDQILGKPACSSITA